MTVKTSFVIENHRPGIIGDPSSEQAKVDRNGAAIEESTYFRGNFVQFRQSR